MSRAELTSSETGITAGGAARAPGAPSAASPMPAYRSGLPCVGGDFICGALDRSLDKSEAQVGLSRSKNEALRIDDAVTGMSRSAEMAPDASGN